MAIVIRMALVIRISSHALHATAVVWVVMVVIRLVILTSTEQMWFRVTRLADPSKCLIQTGCRCCVEFISHMASEALKGVATQQLDEMM